MSSSVAYTSSPLLASKTPVWRSKFIVAAIALGFLGLAGRAAWVQVFGNDFFQKQGEVRFARTLELPANRGRILDRNGLLLATSVPAPSIWAIPEDLERDKAKLAQLARLLEMPLAELDKKLEDEDKTFVWLKRQVDEAVAQQIADAEHQGHLPAQGIQAPVSGGRSRGARGRLHQRRGPRPGRHGARVQQGAGRPARLAPRDQGPARAASSKTWASRCRRWTARDLQLSVDSKMQFFAYQKLRDAVLENKAKAGSVVVLDVGDRRSAGAGQLPELRARASARTSPARNCATAR